MTADFGGAVSDDPCGVLLRTSPRGGHGLCGADVSNGCCGTFLRFLGVFFELSTAITCSSEGSAVLLRNYANQIIDLKTWVWLLLDSFSK